MESALFSLAAGFAVAVALGLAGLFINRRNGLDPWQHELQVTRGAVIQALKDQVEALEARSEADRQHFEKEMAHKDARISHLEEEVRRLERVVDRLTAGVVVDD